MACDEIHEWLSKVLHVMMARNILFCSREGEEKTLHPTHVVMATGMSGFPCIPTFEVGQYIHQLYQYHGLWSNRLTFVTECTCLSLKTMPTGTGRVWREDCALVYCAE